MGMEEKNQIEKAGPDAVTDPIENESAEVVPYSNWMDGLETKKDGKPYQTISNMLYAMEFSPVLAGTIRFNEFIEATELRGVPWKRYSKRISDLDLAYIRFELEKGFLTNKRAIEDAVQIEAARNAYHPVKEVLNAIIWDGKDHISELFPKYLGAERCEYTTMITKIMFGGIIGRQYKPGMKFDTAPVLIDTEQGGGKSSMCKMLAMQDDWYTSLTSLNNENKVVETLTGHLICELEEMETLAKAKNIETVRSFLSRSADTYRTPYDKYPRDIMRKCICIGTSNDENFLPMDRAGNRRFLPIRCNKAKAEVHPLEDETATRKEILQCYAQAMELYQKGELPVKLPKEWEKELPIIQRDFLPEDEKAIRIEQWIVDDWKKITGIGNADTQKEKAKKAYCAAMIYKEALGNDGTPKPWESKEIAVILDKLTDVNGNLLLKRYENSDGIKRIPGYGRCRAWVARDIDIMDVNAGLKNEVSEQNSEQNEVSEQFMTVTEDMESELHWM